MIVPEYIQNCIDALEEAGFAAYCVGGCVRDSLLGLTPHDYDLCTAATPEQLQQVFCHSKLVLAGQKHGTVSVVTQEGLVEITTFRTEGDYQDSRHPDWVRFVPTVEEDLSRRDFTVNAMAYSPARGIIDPWGGQQDLRMGLLRAVGDPTTRFCEDPLRILRGVRFAVRYGLAVEDATHRAMLAQAHLMDHLARERVLDELSKLLPLVTADDLLRFAPIIAQVIPELAPTIGFDQHSPHHAYGLFTHIAHVVEAVPPQLPLRLAALLHDIGKVPTFTRDETGRGHFYGHAKVSAQMADTLLRRLKAPTALREEVVNLIGLHMTRLEPDKRQLRRWLGRLGPQTLDALLTLQQADMGSKGTGKTEDDSQFPTLRTLAAQILEEDSCLSIKDLAVSGSDLISLGFAPGKALGQCLVQLLSLVQDEVIPNTKNALLEQAKHILEN